MGAIVRAYSYSRVSTSTQIRGRGPERQEEEFLKFCARHKLTPSDVFLDLGKSGRGEARYRRALKLFLDRVQSGEIESGSWLVVESVDRLSRQPPTAAFRLFQDIVEQDITVATTFDNEIYSLNSLNANNGQIYILLGAMQRAHNETLTKKVRADDWWKVERLKAQIPGGEKITSNCPAWLQLTPDRKSFKGRVDEGGRNRVDVVRDIFRWADDGIGTLRIAHLLNARGERSFGRGTKWRPAYVHVILRHEAVMGNYQPRDAKGRPVGKEIVGYYGDPTVDADVWLRVQGRTKSGTQVRGRKGAKLTNLFTGLGKCRGCNSNMVIQNNSKINGSYLVCSGAFSKSTQCKCRYWNYQKIEEAILRHVDWLGCGDLFSDDEQKRELKFAAKRSAECKLKLEQLDAEEDRIIDDRAKDKPREVYTRRLDKIEIEKQSVREEQSRLQTEIDLLHAKHQSSQVAGENVARLGAQLASATGDDLFVLRSRLSQAIRQVVEEIAFFPNSGRITVHLAGDLRVWELYQPTRYSAFEVGGSWDRTSGQSSAGAIKLKDWRGVLPEHVANRIINAPPPKGVTAQPFNPARPEMGFSITLPTEAAPWLVQLGLDSKAVADGLRVKIGPEEMELRALIKLTWNVG